MGEGELGEVPNDVRFTGRHDVVVGLRLLQHEPHGLDVFAGVAPVALGVQVAERELRLIGRLDARRRRR